jgi:hypothetical protein
MVERLWFNLPSMAPMPKECIVMRIETETGIGIETGGEAAVEVGIDMTGTDPIRVRGNTVTVAGAAVLVQIATKVVGGPNMMMMSIAVGAIPMGVPPLLGVVVVVVLNLAGAHLLVGHLQKVKTLKYATLRNVLLLQKMLHHVVGQLILEALLLVDQTLMIDGEQHIKL